MAGPLISGGGQWRWFTLLGDVRYLTGSTRGTSSAVSYAGAQPVIGTSSNQASFSAWDVGVRFGPRVPLYFAAISGGIGGSLGAFNASPNDGSQGGGGVFGRGSLWAALDAQPLCDWGLQGGYMYSPAGVQNSANVQMKYETAFFFNLAFQPNLMCSRKRDGLFQLAVVQ
jgi:hypothetical protein